MEKKRCNFSFGTKEYHISEKFLLCYDTRWCKPEHREQELYAMLVLEGMQAGVSWNLILNKEDNFRRAFDGFDPTIVAAYDEQKIEELLQNKGIIRNRNKIKAAITNARAFLKVQEEFGSFDKFIWGFTDGKELKLFDLRTWCFTKAPPCKTGALFVTLPSSRRTRRVRTPPGLLLI